MSGADCKPVGLHDVNVHSMPSTSSRPAPQARQLCGPTVAASVLPDVRLLAIGDQLRRAITWLYEK